MTVPYQFPDHVDDCRYVIGGAWLDIDGQDTERGHVVMVDLDIAVCDRPDVYASLLRSSIDLVIDVRDVASVGQVVSPPQQPSEHVEHDRGTRIADVRRAVNGRSAYVHRHPRPTAGARSTVLWDEGLLAPRQSVVEVNAHDLARPDTRGSGQPVIIARSPAVHHQSGSAPESDKSGFLEDLWRAQDSRAGRRRS